MKNEIFLQGLGVSSGISIGKAVIYANYDIFVEKEDILEESIEREVEKFLEAIQRAKEDYFQLKAKFERETDNRSAQILDFYLLMLSDIAIVDRTLKHIKEKLSNAEYVFNEIIKEYIENIKKTNNNYLIDRIPDISALKQKILRLLLGHDDKECLSIQNLRNLSIIVSHDFSASDVAMVNKEKLAGLITNKGGQTSHTAILARQLEIPSVIGLGDVTEKVKAGDLLIIDGDSGKVVVNPTKETLEKYKKKQLDYLYLNRKYMEEASKPAFTSDGIRIEIGANMSIDDSIDHIKSYGAEGIGLLRTEFLFLDKNPEEEEQFQFYRKFAEGMYPQKVIIRTADIGGDKRTKNWEYENEANPFLGLRGIRYCLKSKEFFKEQLRAILRANTKGNIWIMIPMVSNLEEIVETKNLITDTYMHLKKDGYRVSQNYKFGIMIETPAAVMEAENFAKYVDFFSIGTNDLTQYTLAADRGNQNLNNIFTSYSPAVLKLINHTAEVAKKNNVWVGICGEMASESRALIFLLSLGIDELSMNLYLIPKIKNIIRNLKHHNLLQLKDQVLSMETAKEVIDFLDKMLEKFYGKIRI